MTEVINPSLIQTLLFWGGYQWEVGRHKEKEMKVNVLDAFCIHISK
jgi:hypothetical protein